MFRSPPSWPWTPKQQQPQPQQQSLDEGNNGKVSKAKATTNQRGALLLGCFSPIVVMVFLGRKRESRPSKGSERFFLAVTSARTSFLLFGDRRDANPRRVLCTRRTWGRRWASTTTMAANKTTLCVRNVLSLTSLSHSPPVAVLCVSEQRQVCVLS